MASPEQSGGRSSLRGALSLGLVAIGVLMSVWALASIFARPAVNDPIVSMERVTRSIDTSVTTPTSSTPEATAAPAPYPENPKKGDVFGVLTIPALGQSFPVVEGTGSAELKMGVGHMVETAMPGEQDNCVVSGHRDTVFTDLGKLNVKDLLLVETAKGTFTYQIGQIRIVHKDDRTIVVPADHAVLTVSTCYPFRYVGSAPDRYVLSADLVTSE